MMPNIGYGSNKKTRHMLPNGFHKFTVCNVKVCVRACVCIHAAIIVCTSHSLGGVKCNKANVLPVKVAAPAE